MLCLILIGISIVAAALGLPTRTDSIDDNDYRIALYRDGNRRPGERGLDAIGILQAGLDDAGSPIVLISSDPSDPTNKFLGVRNIDRLGGGHLLAGKYLEQRAMDRLGGGHLLGGRTVLNGDGGGHLLRNLENARFGMYPRQNRGGPTLDSLSGVSFGTNKRLDTLSGIGFGSQKRNFDEIDRSGFNSFIKRNFDEIDRSGFNSFVKKNFDEIDRTGFNSFVKRSTDENQNPTH